MKRPLVLLLVAVWACTPPRGPVTPPVPTPAPTPVVDPQHYARNTPEDTRAAHRLAVAQLQASQWSEALATVEEVQPGDLRRSLTEYFKLVAAVRLPDQALLADRYAEVATRIDVEPGLLSEQRKSLDQHRAWIAAIQDVMADEAESRNFPRPRPDNLPHAHAIAWDSRGAAYDAATYSLTRERFRAAVSTIEGRIEMGEIFRNISAFNVHVVLNVDLTPFHFDFHPPLALPSEAGL